MNLQEWSSFWVHLLLWVSWKVGIYLGWIFLQCLKALFSPNISKDPHKRLSDCSTQVYAVIIHRKLPVCSWYKWTVAPGNLGLGLLVFSNLPFFSMAGWQQSEKSHLAVYLQGTAQEQKRVSVPQTHKQTFEKKSRMLTSNQTVRARNIILIPFINIHFCLSHFQLLLLCRRYFYWIFFYHFHPYYIYSFHVYLCSPFSLIG